MSVHYRPRPRSGALLNRERATDVMRRAGIDAIVVSSPLNTYYVTNAVPVLSRFTQLNTAFAVLPADPKRPAAYIAGGFEYYAGVSDSGLAQGVVPYLAGGTFTAPRFWCEPGLSNGGNVCIRCA